MSLTEHQEAAPMHQKEDEEPPDNLKRVEALTQRIKETCIRFFESSLECCASKDLDDDYLTNKPLRFLKALERTNAWKILPQKSRDDIRRFVEEIRLQIATMH